MVLCLKTRESRSLPGLSRISPHHKDKTHQRGGRLLSPPRCRLKPGPEHGSKPNRTSQDNTVDAGWSSPVARQAHNLKVVSSNLAPATKSPQYPKSPVAPAMGLLRERRGKGRAAIATPRGQRQRAPLLWPRFRISKRLIRRFCLLAEQTRPDPKSVVHHHP